MRTVELNQVQIDWLLAVAYVYIQNNKYSDATNLLELVLSNYNRNLEAIRGLGYCYLASERYEECIKACNRFMLLSREIQVDNPTISRVYLILAKANKQLGRLNEAREAMVTYRNLANRQNAQSQSE